MQLGTGTTVTNAAGNIPDASDVSLTSSGSVLDMNGYRETINTLASTFTQSVVSSSGSGNYTLTIGISTNGPTTNNTIYNGILQDNIGGGSGSMNIEYNLYGTGYIATLGGVNTYSGLTTITQGMLAITSSSALGKHASSGGLGTVVTSNGQLRLSSNISVGNESLTINGNLNNGALYNNGGTNVWGGSITIGSASTTIWNNAGALTVDPESGVAVSSTNLPLTISGNGSSTISGTVSLGTGTLTTNNGTVTLMYGNSYSGLTTVSSGILNIRNSTSLGTGSVTVLNGATLQLQGGISVGNTLTLNGAGNGGALRSISGDNIYTGNITLSTNNVRINTDANTLTINGNISGGSIALYVGGVGNTVMNGVLSGAGGSLTFGISPTQVTSNTSFIKDGNGTVRLVGVNTYTGATVLDVGLLELGANNVISNASNMLFDGGRLDTRGYNESMGTLSVLAESSSVTLGSGSHVLSFSGIGTLDYKTLTINGWVGTSGSTGSDGVLLVGNSLSFTRAQLDQFKFSYNSGTYSALQLSDGELVPGVAGATGFVNIRITNGSTTNGNWSLASGTYTFVPTANNATINIADIYSHLFSNGSNVTINTTLASGTQVGQVDINNAITGDLNSNLTRTLTLNANGDINVNQSITLANSSSSNILYSTHSLVMSSTTGSINILASISTQRISGSTGNAIWSSYGSSSGNITLSAPMGTIYASVAGTLNASGTVNTSNSGGGWDGAAGVISLSSMGYRILSTITATSRFNAAQWGNISITNTGTSVTSGGGVNDGISGVITGRNFTKAGVGSLRVSGNNGWNGTTTISGGTLQLGTGTTVTNTVGNIPDGSAVYLAGGELNDGGFNETMGALWLTNNSSIVTGNTNHNLIFSSPGTFTTGRVLTIKGWTGSSESNALNKFGGIVGSSTEFITATGARQSAVVGGLNQFGKILYGLEGNVATTSSQIFINTTRLTTTQLNQIQFLNSATNGYYTTVQKASPSFEIVPGVSK